MVLGCYYLTAENPADTKGQGRYFASLDDVAIAYDRNLIGIHAYVWVRFDGDMVMEEEEGEPKDVQTTDDGIITEVYSHRRIRKDAEGNVISQYIYTTAGRVILNKTLHDVLV
jgi:DNA-directed RNA polymerase subunit beta'